jgi:hypothetical protein
VDYKDAFTVKLSSKELNKPTTILGVKDGEGDLDREGWCYTRFNSWAKKVNENDCVPVELNKDDKLGYCIKIYEKCFQLTKTVSR